MDQFLTYIMLISIVQHGKDGIIWLILGVLIWSMVPQHKLQNFMKIRLMFGNT